MNNNAPKIGCGTILIIILVILFLIGGGSNSSSKSTSTYSQTKTSNPIRDRDPEFYDSLERRYNEMIKNQGNP